MSAATPGDLALIVADSNMEHLMDALLGGRRQALAAHEIGSVALHKPIQRLQGKDAGALSPALAQLARYLLRPARNLIVAFDHEGCGRESDKAADLECEVEDLLSRNGWSGRVCVVCIEPELDTWVWANRRALAEALCTDDASIERVLAASHLAEVDAYGKPTRPKEALEAVLASLRARRSSSVYARVAARAGFRHCQDRAFQKMLAFLREQFPLES